MFVLARGQLCGTPDRLSYQGTSCSRACVCLSAALAPWCSTDNHLGGQQFMAGTPRQSQNHGTAVQSLATAGLHFIDMLSCAVWAELLDTLRMVPSTAML